MKLSRTAAYAIHAAVYIARQTPGKPVIGHETATNLGMPEGFLLRILVALSRARILTSVKGPNGGYQLARRPAEITLLDVMEAVEGPIRAEAPWIGSSKAGALLTFGTIRSFFVASDRTTGGLTMFFRLFFMAGSRMLLAGSLYQETPATPCSSPPLVGPYRSSHFAQYFHKRF